MANVVQTRVQDSPKRGVVGYPAFPARNSNINSMQNGNGGTKAIKTLTVSFEDDGVYKHLFEGEVRSFTEDAEGTADNVASAIGTKDSTYPNIVKLAAVSILANVITYTGKYDGKDFDLEASSSNLAVATTQEAAEAAPMPFGKAVMDAGPADTGNKRKAKLLDNDGLTGRQIIVTPGAAAATLTVVFEGQHYTATATGAAALKTAIDAALPANSVNTTVNGSDLELDVATAGAWFDVVLGGDLVFKSAAGEDIIAKIEGITCYTSRSVDGRGYEPKATMDVITEDGAWVEAAAGTPAYGGQLWVGVQNGAQGKFYAERGADRVLWTGAKIGDVESKRFQALF